MFSRRRRASHPDPLLSVIIPVYQVEEHVDACLRTVRDQEYRSIEIVVVNDGTRDASMDIVRRHAADDDRFVIIEQDNAGLSAARNTGVAASTGEFIVFIDSDDLFTPDGLAAAMASLASSGSDIAVLNYGRLREGVEAPAASWIRKAHRERRIGVSLEEYPDVLINATAWGKVFRRSFYESADLRFIPSFVFEDQPFTSEAYAKAAAIDVLPEIGVWWRVNEESLSQGHVTVDNLLWRIKAAEVTLENLAHHPVGLAKRAEQYAQQNFRNMALKLERADDDYLQAMIDHLPPIIDQAHFDNVHDHVPAEFRVMYELLRLGDHDAILRFVQAEGMQPEMHPAGLEAGGLTVYLPGWQQNDVDPSFYVLTEEQLALKARVRSVDVRGVDLVLHLTARFPFADHTGAQLSVDAGRLSAEVEQNGEPVVVASRQGAERRYPGTGWTVTLRGGARKRPATIRVTMTADGRTSTRNVKIPV